MQDRRPRGWQDGWGTHVQGQQLWSQGLDLTPPGRKLLSQPPRHQHPVFISTPQQDLPLLRFFDDYLPGTGG